MSASAMKIWSNEAFANAALGRRVPDHDELPGLEILGRRRQTRGFEDTEKRLLRDGIPLKRRMLRRSRMISRTLMSPPYPLRPSRFSQDPDLPARANGPDLSKAIVRRPQIDSTTISPEKRQGAGGFARRS